MALLTALSLVLGYFDHAIPILGGMIPGFKLGLANTVILFALFMMDWPWSILLMFLKVTLSALLFGNMQAYLVSLGGGVLSLAVMLAVRKKASGGVLAVAVLSLAALLWTLIRYPHPRGQILLSVVLGALALTGSVVVYVLMKKGKINNIMGTSLCGAVAHNLGQTIVSIFVFMMAKQFLITYFPFLVVVGAVVGCLTGLVTDRVIRVLRASGALKEGKTA